MTTRCRPTRTEAPAPGRTALAVVKTRHAARRAADLALVVSIVDWAVEHTDHDPVPLTEEEAVFSPTSLALAGAGAPVVEDFALYQLAAALSRTIESGPSAVEPGEPLGESESRPSRDTHSPFLGTSPGLDTLRRGLVPRPRSLLDHR